jgi:hypothetical protein
MATDDHLLGFTRPLFLDSHDLESARLAPAGWNLLAVNVDHGLRRRGVDPALTRARL